MLLEVTPAEKDFIETVLNNEYTNNTEKLKRKNLGDIERRLLEQSNRFALNLIRRFEKIYV